jgi:hypothetical protein
MVIYLNLVNLSKGGTIQAINIAVSLLLFWVLYRLSTLTKKLQFWMEKRRRQQSRGSLVNKA